jgi:hypothetical protein
VDCLVRPPVPSLVGALSTGPVSRIGGFGGGFAAGGAFLVVELGARVLWKAPTLPELIQDRLVQATTRDHGCSARCAVDAWAYSSVPANSG